MILTSASRFFFFFFFFLLLVYRTECIQDGWMDDCLFYVLFNSIAVISERWADDKERLFAMEHRLRSPRAGLELGTARSVDQRLTH